MTEYVCRIDESRADAMGNVPCERCEEIVRCRACCYFSAYESWDGGWCSEWAGETNPDGFCHLGEDGHAEEA